MKNKKIPLIVVVVFVGIICVIIITRLSIISVSALEEPSTGEKQKAIKENQISFLKDHENELSEYIKKTNPKSNIYHIYYNWDSLKTKDSGAYTQESYVLNITLYDKANTKINGGIITILPDNIDDPSQIDELSTNNFDKEIGVDD